MNGSYTGLVKLIVLCASCFDFVDNLFCTTHRRLRCCFDGHVILNTSVDPLSGPSSETGAVPALALTPLKFIEIARHADKKCSQRSQYLEPMIARAFVKEHLVDDNGIPRPN